ncbi:MAG: hypothetical protein AAF355_05645 [Myxococcota bacterium]
MRPMLPTDLADEPRLEPLQTRPGAGFLCLGDGLCCSDIHGIGPLSDDESQLLTLVAPEAVSRAEAEDADCISFKDDGTCVFWQPDGCILHQKLGAPVKPTSCRRYPYGLTATPLGGRITTEHRCPCRTVGTRPAISLEEASLSILDEQQEPVAERAIVDVPLEDGRRVPFAIYREREIEWITALNRGEDPCRVLSGRVEPEVPGETYVAWAQRWLDPEHSSRFDFAMGWVADTILRRHGFDRPIRGRPWSEAFERAALRPTVRRSRMEVIADWVADEIWSLKWVAFGSLRIAFDDLCTRAAWASSFAETLETQGIRPDCAAAEAVMALELAGSVESWGAMLRRWRDHLHPSS